MATITPDKTLMAENIALQVWLTPIEESTNTVTVGDRTYAYSPNCHKSWFDIKPWIIKFHIKDSDSEEMTKSRVTKDTKKDIELIEEVFDVEDIKHESFQELISHGRAVLVEEENEYKFEQIIDDSKQQKPLEHEELLLIKQEHVELEALSSSTNEVSEIWRETSTYPSNIDTNWSNINVFIQSQRGLSLKSVIEHLSNIPSVPNKISMTRPPEIFGFSLQKLPIKPRYYCPITELPLNHNNAIQIKTLDLQTKQYVWKTVSRTGVRQIILTGPGDFNTRGFLSHRNELTPDDLRPVTASNLTPDSVLKKILEKNGMPILSE